MSISAGTLDQGASYSLTTGTVTLKAGAAWTNTGSGAVTLGGNVINSGSITFSDYQLTLPVSTIVPK